MNNNNNYIMTDDGLDIPNYIQNREKFAQTSYENSAKKREPISTSKKTTKKYTRKQIATAIISAVIIAGAASSITYGVDNMFEQREIDNTVEKACSEYKEMIDSAVKSAEITRQITHPDRVLDSGQVVNYDKSKIADAIENFATTIEERDMAVFTLYNYYGTNTSESALNGITEGTVKNLSKDETTTYESLTDYINDLGYQDLNEYKEKMEEKIVAKYNYEQLNNASNIGGK